jgi:hypothetical protein
MMKLHAALILTTLLAYSGSAFAQTVGIHVTNGDTQDLYVTVADQNQSGQVVFNNQRLNRGTRVDLPITADGSGNGSVAWRVVTTDTQQAACGSASGLGPGSEVNVATSGMDISPC